MVVLCFIDNHVYLVSFSDISSNISTFVSLHVAVDRAAVLKKYSRPVADPVVARWG